MTYIKAKHLNRDLSGEWEVTYKIDGVRAFKDEAGKVTSRNNKPLYNLDHLEFTDAEIFRKDWETSVSLVRTQTHVDVFQEDVYSLSPLDSRLHSGKVLLNPTRADCIAEMLDARSKGYEGIVLRQGNKWVKVVPTITEDLKIVYYKYGTGKYKDMLGAFITSKGAVGTGFTDEQRRRFAQVGLSTFIGETIEVSYREKTPDGNLRFPVFVRMRYDKEGE